jgi:hypothetical protein
MWLLWLQVGRVIGVMMWLLWLQVGRVIGVMRRSMSVRVTLARTQGLALTIRTAMSVTAMPAPKVNSADSEIEE